MRNLFEYLISKENKKNIVIGIKGMLRSGDIVGFADDEFYLYISKKDLEKDKILMSKIDSRIDISEGMFVYSFGRDNEIAHRGLDIYTNMLKGIKKYIPSAISIYPGDGEFPKYKDLKDINKQGVLKMKSKRIGKTI